jgi:hypothetical protein
VCSLQLYCHCSLVLSVNEDREYIHLVHVYSCIKHLNLYLFYKYLVRFKTMKLEQCFWFIFTFWCDWSLNSGLWKVVLYCLSHTSSSFFSSYFGEEILLTICQGWAQTMILLILVSWVIRMTGVNHQHSGH